jgi:hypothetical protein
MLPASRPRHEARSCVTAEAFVGSGVVRNSGQAAPVRRRCPPPPLPVSRPAGVRAIAEKPCLPTARPCRLSRARRCAGLLEALFRLHHGQRRRPGTIQTRPDPTPGAFSSQPRVPTFSEPSAARHFGVGPQRSVRAPRREPLLMVARLTGRDQMMARRPGRSLSLSSHAP